MDYVKLGNTGLKVSRICLGCMTYGSPATGKLLPGRQPWALNEAIASPSFDKLSISASISGIPPTSTPAATAS